MSEYLKIIKNKDRSYEYQQGEKRNREKVRSFLAKRVGTNDRTYYHRLGYDRAVSSYTKDISIDRLSGSSLNRLYAYRRKIELEKIYQRKKEAAKEAGGYFDDWGNWCAPDDLLRTDKIIEPRDTTKFSVTVDRINDPVHLLSIRSKAKIRDKFTAFYRSCGPAKTFATLTFIQSIDDKTAVSILNKWFTELRDRFLNFKYIWVIERQENGNPHFHCVFNRRLPVKIYNSLWVVQQYNAGLQYGNITKEEIHLRHVTGSMQEILNPFSITKIKSDYGLSWYLTKYITKNISDGFGCNTWHCSRAVSRLFTKTIVSSNCIRAASDININSRINKQTGEIIKREKKKPFYQMYYIENKPYFLWEMRELEKVNWWILNENYLPPEIPVSDEGDIRNIYNN